MSLFAGAALVDFAVIWHGAVVTLLACVVYASRPLAAGIKFLGSRHTVAPLNVLLSSRLLTGEGLRHRQRCLKSLAMSAALVGGTLLFAATTGNLR